MAFYLPTFNLTCNIWIGVDITSNVVHGPPDLAAVPCNLQMARKNAMTAGVTMWVLLPAGTDVRSDTTFGPMQCVIECPAGTGRFYFVSVVDDAMKGFPSEYRVACVSMIELFFYLTVDPQWFWPTPYP